MPNNEDIFTRLTINGFTINPVTYPPILNAIMLGLTGYGEYHYCDHGIGLKHKNYLGKRISDPVISMNNSEKDHGLTGMCFLENGYFIIKIWDNVYPAHIQFDLFLTDRVDDLDLLVDHLCAPAVPWDGLGMFDYTYNQTLITPNNHILQKKNIKDSSYFVNPPIKFEDDENDWSIRLNQLSKISCYFCENISDKWLLVKTSREHPSNARVVAVCKDHIKMGRSGEVIPNSLDQTISADYYTPDIDTKFKQQEVVDESTGESYTINVVDTED